MEVPGLTDVDNGLLTTVSRLNVVARYLSTLLLHPSYDRGVASAER